MKWNSDLISWSCLQVVACPQGPWHLLNSPGHEDQEELFGFGRVGVVDQDTSSETRLHGLRRDHLNLGRVLGVKLEHGPGPTTLKKETINWYFFSGFFFSFSGRVLLVVKFPSAEFSLVSYSHYHFEIVLHISERRWLKKQVLKGNNPDFKKLSASQK